MQAASVGIVTGSRVTGCVISPLQAASFAGRLWSPVSEAWHPFEVDLLTGKSRGAVYPEQMFGPQRA